jgi:hypothetical protein
MRQVNTAYLNLVEGDKLSPSAKFEKDLACHQRRARLIRVDTADQEDLDASQSHRAEPAITSCPSAPAHCTNLVPAGRVERTNWHGMGLVATVMSGFQYRWLVQ